MYMISKVHCSYQDSYFTLVLLVDILIWRYRSETVYCYLQRTKATLVGRLR